MDRRIAAALELRLMRPPKGRAASRHLRQVVCCRQAGSPGVVMRLLRVVLVVAVMVAAYSARPALAAGSCGTFVDPDGARIEARVVRGGVSCVTAKRVLGEYARSIKQTACSSNACPRKVRRFVCSSAPFGAFPRLYSCNTRTSRVAAYSTAD